MSGNDPVNASQKALKESVKLINDTAGQIQQLQQRLHDTVRGGPKAGGNALVGRSWDGSSARAFAKVHDDWQFWTDDILKALLELAMGIDTAGKDYRAFEADRTEAARRINNIINSIDVPGPDGATQQAIQDQRG